jgi:hypothetical protein
MDQINHIDVSALECTDKDEVERGGLLVLQVATNRKFYKDKLLS